MTGTPARYFAEPDRYLARNPNLETRRILVREMLPRPLPRSVLDAGCGDGSASLQFLPELEHLTLLDGSGPMLDRARAGVPADLAARVDFVHADLLAFAPGRRYDLVLCLGVLAHVAPVRDVLHRLAGWLRPGGTCLVQITDADRLAGRLTYGYDRRRRRRGLSGGHDTNRTRSSQITALARECGLSPAAARRYCAVVPGMGRLPASWGRFAARHVLANRGFSLLGSEVILRFDAT